MKDDRRAEEKREGSSAEMLVLCNGHFFVVFNVRSIDGCVSSALWNKCCTDALSQV